MKRIRNIFFPDAVWKHFTASLPCILQNKSHLMKQKWTKMRSELQETIYFLQHTMETSFSVPQLEISHHMIISCSDSKSKMATLNFIFFPLTLVCKYTALQTKHTQRIHIITKSLFLEAILDPQLVQRAWHSCNISSFSLFLWVPAWQSSTT